MSSAESVTKLRNLIETLGPAQLGANGNSF